MLDPLSTISFTSNIVQFLDFAGEVVSGARELYNSEKGTTEANQELEDLAKAIQDHARKIKSNEISIVENEASYQLEILLRLSQKCEKVALELLEVLGTLELKDNRRGWSSVVNMTVSLIDCNPINYLVFILCTECTNLTVC